MVAKIDYSKCCWKDGKCSSCSCCRTCNGCVEACPVEAITRKKKVVIDKKKCISCSACVIARKYGAISVD